MNHKFQFTRHWFSSRNKRTFADYVLPEWKYKKAFYLELGVFEGMSLSWMVLNVLDHPDSRAVGVDPWLMTSKLSSEVMEKVRERAFHNLGPWIGEKVGLVRGSSTEVLRYALRRKQGFMGIRRKGVDLCMIDGNHHAFAVLDDLRLVYKLVRRGGWIMLDDVENQQKKKHHVKEGLAIWLDTDNPRVDLVTKHRYMEIYRKL